MPTPTHQELVLEEIVRQWPERVEARASLMQRPLGSDPVSDAEAENKYFQRNPNPQAVIQAVMQQPQMSDWEITKLIYPYREAVLQGIKNMHGFKAMMRFEQKMEQRGGPGAPSQSETRQGQEQEANRAY